MVEGSVQLRGGDPKGHLHGLIWSNKKPDMTVKTWYDFRFGHDLYPHIRVQVTMKTDMPRATWYDTGVKGSGESESWGVQDQEKNIELVCSRICRHLRARATDLWCSVWRRFTVATWSPLVCVTAVTKPLRPHGTARYVHNPTIYEHMRREFCRCGAHTATTHATCGKVSSLCSRGGGKSEAYLSASKLWFNKVCPSIAIRNPAD